MKARQFDKEIKTKIIKVEKKGTPTFHWDQEKTWNKIKETLSVPKGKAILWYCSMAASVSMLLGNSVQWADLLLPLDEPTLTHVSAKSQENKNQVSEFSTPMTEKIKIEVATTSRPIAQEPDPEVTLSTENTQTPKEEWSISANSTRINPSAAIKVKPFGSLQTTTNRTTIAAGVSAWKSIPNTTFGIDQIGVSLETRHQVHQWYTSESNLATHNRMLFASAIVGKEDLWTLGLGYNLLLQKNQPQDTQAVKIYYQRKVNKIMQVGPEIIFSGNFKQVYPGISVTFG